MNARTLVLIGAIALVGIGAVMMLGDLFAAPEPVAQISPAMAVTQIQPYTVITQDMVAQGDPLTQRQASAVGAWQVRDVVGKMSTNLIPAGAMLTTKNALPIEEARIVADPSLEVVSFSAGVDRLVAGKIKPGALINVYGNGMDNVSNLPYTVLVEPRVWVVDVSSGGSPVTNATVVPDSAGNLTVTGGDQNRPATTITVAVPPEKAFRLIDAFGAQGLNAWVSLAANQTANAGGPATPVPGPTATPPGLDPALALTATAIWLASQATPVPIPPSTGDGWGAGR
jgi:hypothetical protein